MGAAVPSRAPNDAEFLKTATAMQDTERQTTCTYKPSSHCFKPMFRSEKAPEIFYYPGHPIFRNRIPFEHWKRFNADTDEALYRSALHCMGPQFICPLTSILTCALDRHYYAEFNALYEVLAYYNRVLFHPMLIDAQVFFREYTSDGSSSSPWLISFLIARSPDHFRTFPRPVPGRSSGYRTYGAPHLPCLKMDFFLDGPVVVPEHLPEVAPEFDTMYPHSAERLAQTPEPLWDVFPCCVMVNEERRAERPQPYPIPAEWSQSNRAPRYYVAQAEFVDVEVTSATASAGPVVAVAAQAVPLASLGYEMVAQSAHYEDLSPKRR